MMDSTVLPLVKLGPRIMILGPSSSGKSTLAAHIAMKIALPVIHLDQLFHRPNTDWEPQPFNVFKKMHQLAINEDRWVMEGNYTKLLPERLARNRAHFVRYQYIIGLLSLSTANL